MFNVGNDFNTQRNVLNTSSFMRHLTAKNCTIEMKSRDFLVKEGNTTVHHGYYDQEFISLAPERKYLEYNELFAWLKRHGFEQINHNDPTYYIFQNKELNNTVSILREIKLHIPADAKVFQDVNILDKDALVPAIHESATAVSTYELVEPVYKTYYLESDHYYVEYNDAYTIKHYSTTGPTESLQYLTAKEFVAELEQYGFKPGRPHGATPTTSSDEIWYHHEEQRICINIDSNEVIRIPVPIKHKFTMAKVSFADEINYKAYEEVVTLLKQRGYQEFETDMYRHSGKALIAKIDKRTQHIEFHHDLELLNARIQNDAHAAQQSLDRLSKKISKLIISEKESSYH